MVLSSQKAVTSNSLKKIREQHFKTCLKQRNSCKQRYSIILSNSFTQEPLLNNLVKNMIEKLIYCVINIYYYWQNTTGRNDNKKRCKIKILCDKYILLLTKYNNDKETMTRKDIDIHRKYTPRIKNQHKDWPLELTQLSDLVKYFLF